MLHPNYLLIGLLWLLAIDCKAEQALLTWEATDRALNLYCYECHGGFSTDAGLDLINIDPRADLVAQPERWAEVAHALRTHYMPHPDGREMPQEARQQLVRKIESELVLLAADYQPTSASLRRLNRVEFNNSLNDLFFIEGDWASALPADDAGYGFDNIAAALTVSPLLMERYFDVAASVAGVAVPQRWPQQEWQLGAGEWTGGHNRGSSRVIVANGARHAVKQRVFFPANGRYDLQFALSAEQAGSEKARAAFYLDGQAVAEYEVSAAKGDAAEVFEQSISIQRAGEHLLELRFLNDYYQQDATGKLDRNLIFHHVRLLGPEQSSEDLQSLFLDRHFGSQPELLSRQKMRDGIHRFASRAYRRPALVEEVDALWRVFQANDGGNREGRDVRNGLYAVIDAVLSSPSFLFRFEGQVDSMREDSFALASWLSYFLWSSMPDDRLFELALRRQLHENLASEVTRMLADPKAIALAQNFAGQWWRIRDLEVHQPDLSIYKNANRKLLQAMREETEQFFMYVLEHDRPVLDFLNADYTFANQLLAEHYGISGVRGADFRKVSIADTPRRGVWAQGGVLTVSSYPNHTSPVLRGQWILENLIGLAPPPPPDNIPSLPNTEGRPDPSDLRVSLAQHRANPNCASCHDIMDPFGLALEHFDGVGRLRSPKERKELTEETLFDGARIASPIELAQYFEQQRSGDFVRNVAGKLAIYAAGRGLDWRDDAALQRIADATAAQDFRFSALVQAVVKEFAPLPNTNMLSISHHTP